MKKTVTEILGLAINSGFVSEAEIIGCNAEDISSLESRVGMDLPPIYKSFLKIMGRRIGDLLMGDDVYIDVLGRLQDEGTSWATDKNPKIIECSPFFYYGHQAYEFVFFAPINEDPPAYAVSDSMPFPQIVDENLSGALYQMVEQGIYNYQCTHHISDRHLQKELEKKSRKP